MLEFYTINVFVLDNYSAICVPIFCLGAFNSQFENLRILKIKILCVCFVTISSVQNLLLTLGKSGDRLVLLKFQDL